MEDNQFLSMMVYSGGALAAWLGAIFALGIFIVLQRQYRERMMGWLGPLSLLGMGIGAILSGRNITSAEFEIATAAGAESDAVTWFMRMVTMVTLGICAARLISVSQQQEHRSRAGMALFAGFVLFYVTNLVLNNLFGTRPTFDQRTIYPLMVFAAVYYTRNKDQNYLLDGARTGLFFFMLASCVVAAVMPHIAVQADYAEGIIPGLNIRLWGLGSNPNSIGPMALVLLLLLAQRPFRNRLLQYAAILTGLAILVLAQSKTAWGATALAFAVLWWGRLRSEPQARRQGMRGFAGPLIISLGGFLLVCTVAYVTVFTDVLVNLAHDKQVVTLTGRTAIWEVAINTWKENPLFGYGSSMWDAAFRQTIEMDFAYNAHNQFLQTLSTAGVIGMFGLVVYTLLLLRYAIAANRATRGFSMALFSMMFLRYFTETPLNMTSIFAGEFLTHLLLFAVILNKGRSYVPAEYPQPGYPSHQLQW